MGRDWVLTMVLKGIVLRLTHGENDQTQNSMGRIGRGWGGLQHILVKPNHSWRIESEMSG
jgi:hypothetical protein